MIAIVPGYISRSVAGSYDNEGIAIFCMLLTYYLWIKSVKTGQIYWSALCSIAYFYMVSSNSSKFHRISCVDNRSFSCLIRAKCFFYCLFQVSSWGGYVFLINLIPLHVFTLMICGRYSHKVYVAYSTVYALGTILSMQISFVGFQPVQTSEHMMSLGVFGLCQIHSFIDYLRANMTKENFATLTKTIAITVATVISGGVAVMTLSGKVAPWTGRFYSLLDPSYAKNNIPIIASVSEHQPTAWSSFYFDLQVFNG